MKKYFYLVCLSPFLSSCMHLNSISITQIPEKRNKTISAESSQFYFFGISFSNNYADEVVRKLMSKCSGGKIEGILTKDEQVNYFLGIIAKKQVIAKGYCN